MASYKFTRGDTAILEAGFFEDSAQEFPRPPADENQPTYEIVNPDGTVIASGTADPVAGNEGFYRVTWDVPATAVLSRDGKPWRVDYTFIDVGGGTVAYSQEFEVLPRETTRQQESRHGYLTFVGHGTTFQNRRVRRPHEISINVSRSADGLQLVTARQVLGTGPEELVDGSVYVYQDQLDKNDVEADSTYSIIWTIKETATSLPDFETEILNVVSPAWVPYLHHFDMMMNKLKARATEVQSWTPHEKFNALMNGLRIVNAWHPNQVQYSMTTFPHGQLGHYVLMAAQFWALNSLHMLEGQLAFNFSGQSATLDYDHTGWVESAMSRALDYLNTNLTNSKMAILRRARPTGVVNVRPMSLSYRDRTIIPIERTQGAVSNWTGFLTSLGLV